MIDKSQYIYGIHAVLEAFDAGKDIDKILLSKTLNADTAQEIINLARELNVPVQRVPVQKIDRITRRNHQGVIAMMAAVTYYKAEDLVPQLFDEGENPFIDVASDSWYAKAVLWAVERGITTGTSAITFDPEDTCTRAHIVTFLWRAAGKPGETPAPRTWYSDAMAWAGSEGLFADVSIDLPEASEPCPRSEIVSYIYNQMK